MDEIFERESLIIGVEGVEKLQQCKVALLVLAGLVLLLLKHWHVQG